MLISKALATGILAGSAAALLLTGPTLRGLKTGDNTVGPPAADWSREQRPLTRTQGSAPRQPGAAELPAYRAGRFTLVPQDNTTCAAYGESQWSGTVDVTDSRRLFFWFADSRNDPENDPVVIWINGGPGASSMMGLLIEMGPCWLDEDANTTVPNAWAWNNNASVLFIDQPAGVGFASVAEGAPLPASDLDGAQDFQVFLNTFFSDVFPDRAHLPIHFAAESYGGHFAPTYVKHILDSRQYDSKTAFRGNITSLILVDALIDFTSVAIGQYELLCSEFRRGSAAPGGNILNDTACEQIRLSVPECERLGRSCDLSYDGLECLAAFSFCQSRITAHYLELMAAGLRGDHNIHKPCKHRPVRGYPDSWGCADPGKGDFEQYLNLPHVKSALGFPASFVFDDFKADIYHAYASSGSQFKPTSRELAAVLDAHRTPGLGDVRVLVLQGNVDFACNTPGNVWLYDKLLWSGLADYRMMKWEDMPADMAATGFWKATPDGRMAFVAVDDAGHTVPGDAREGSYRILQRWIEGGWHM